MDPIREAAEYILTYLNPDIVSNITQSIGCNPQDDHQFDFACLIYTNINLTSVQAIIVQTLKETGYEPLLRETSKKSKVSIRSIIGILAKFMVNSRIISLRKYFVENPNLQKYPRPVIPKYILYRFASIEEPWTRNLEHVYKSNLRSLYDMGIISAGEIQSLRVTHNFDFEIIPILYSIRSSTKRNISIREYLDVNKGVGGNIVGFQEFSGISPYNLMQGNIGTVLGAYTAFSDSGRRPLLVFRTTSLRPLNLSSIIMPEVAQRSDYIPITGQFSRYRDPESQAESQVEPELIPYEPGIVKTFQAGSAMPDPNLAEYNIIADIDLLGYQLVVYPNVGVTLYAAYELLLAASQRSDLLTLSLAPPIQNDVPVPFSLPYP